MTELERKLDEAGFLSDAYKLARIRELDRQIQEWLESQRIYPGYL